MRGGCLARTFAVVLIAVVFPVAAARAKPSDAYRAPYERGLRSYDAGDMETALASFEEAYRLRPLPGLLFNIAQARRKLGQNALALAAYERFLVEEPHIPREDRARVEGHIAHLRALLAGPQTPPPAPTPAPITVTETTPPPPAPAPVVMPAPVIAAAPPPPPTPLYRRAWLWATVASGVVLGVGVATGVAVAANADPTADIPPSNRFRVGF